MSIDPFSIALGVGGIASNIINNKQQLDFAEKNYQFQRYQYEDMKRFNSAAEQVKRLRAAGMNPALTFGQNAGMAQAASSPAGPTTSPLDLNGLASISQGISLNQAQAANIDANTAKTRVDTEGSKVDLAFKEQDWLSKLYNRDSDSWYKDMMSKNIKLNNSYLQDTMKDRIWMQKMQAQEQQARAYAQHYLLPYVPLKAQGELENLAANTKLALQNGVATLKQAHAAIMNAETTKKAFQAQYGYNPKMWKQFSEATFDYLVQQKNTSASQEFRNITTEYKNPAHSWTWTDYHEYNKFRKRYNKSN